MAGGGVPQTSTNGRMQKTLWHQFSDPATRDPSELTTIMVRNVPRSYTEEALFQELGSVIRRELCNFLYLPWDARRRSNVGYAFVNMVDAETARLASQLLEGAKWKLISSTRTIKVVYAHLQGLEQNLAQYVGTAVVEENHEHAPMVFIKGKQIPFQEAVRLLCPPGLVEQRLVQLVEARNQQVPNSVVDPISWSNHGSSENSQDDASFFKGKRSFGQARNSRTDASRQCFSPSTKGGRTDASRQCFSPSTKGGRHVGGHCGVKSPPLRGDDPGHSLEEVVLFTSPAYGAEYTFYPESRAPTAYQSEATPYQSEATPYQSEATEWESPYQSESTQYQSESTPYQSESTPYQSESTPCQSERLSHYQREPMPSMLYQSDYRPCQSVKYQREPMPCQSDYSPCHSAESSNYQRHPMPNMSEYTPYFPEATDYNSRPKKYGPPAPISCRQSPTASTDTMTCRPSQKKVHGPQKPEVLLGATNHHNLRRQQGAEPKDEYFECHEYPSPEVISNRWGDFTSSEASSNGDCAARGSLPLIRGTNGYDEAWRRLNEQLEGLAALQARNTRDGHPADFEDGLPLDV